MTTMRSLYETYKETTPAPHKAFSSFKSKGDLEALIEQFTQPKKKETTPAKAPISAVIALQLRGSPPHLIVKAIFSLFAISGCTYLRRDASANPSALKMLHPASRSGPAIADSGPI